MNEAVYFDIAAETRLRPTCLKCDTTVQVGIAYVRHGRSYGSLPTIEYYHEACAPAWMVEQAKKSTGKRKAGE